MVYDENWFCIDNSVQFSNNTLSPVLRSSDLDNDMEITVVTSEPLATLNVAIPELGIDGFALESNSDSIVWVGIINSDSLLNSPEKVSLEFSGNDLNNNALSY